MDKETQVYYEIKGYLSEASKNKYKSLTKKEADYAKKILGLMEDWLKEKQ